MQAHVELTETWLELHANQQTRTVTLIIDDNDLVGAFLDSLFMW